MKKINLFLILLFSVTVSFGQDFEAMKKEYRKIYMENGYTKEQADSIALVIVSPMEQQKKKEELMQKQFLKKIYRP
ncbi:MAG: hypothetical protein HC831_09940 [Chloroflexia bacterium]|nr:hypothetical protein [Chloroflexia bacterium]